MAICRWRINSKMLFIKNPRTLQAGRESCRSIAGLLLWKNQKEVKCFKSAVSLFNHKINMWSTSGRKETPQGKERLLKGRRDSPREGETPQGKETPQEKERLLGGRRDSSGEGDSSREGETPQEKERLLRGRRDSSREGETPQGKETLLKRRRDSSGEEVSVSLGSSDGDKKWFWGERFSVFGGSMKSRSEDFILCTEGLSL